MPAGRPPLYTSPDDMQVIIDEYFAECDTDGRPYTMSGLALALGMERTTLVGYSHKDEFINTLKAARARVERRLEERLDGGNATGTIFNLKNNFGWKDVQEQSHSGEIVHKIEYEIVDPSGSGS